MFGAKILADSTNPAGERLTTMELTYPRCIHAEFMTHRMFSRNSASSRAIPVEKMLKNIMDDPFIPLHWGKNQKGMQAEQELTPAEQQAAKRNWLLARDQAVANAEYMRELGLHKQLTNRIVEPWMWITVIATASEPGWENFFNLRCDAPAEPHIREIAFMARDLYDDNTPNELEWGQDHLPLFGFEGDETLSQEDARKVSTGRCARVSYRTHDGRRDVSEDIGLHDRLAGNNHWSPFEHVATAMTSGERLCGNLVGHWIQYRKRFPTELCSKAPRRPKP